MSLSALAARRQLLGAAACLQRARLGLDLLALRRRGGVCLRAAPALFGAAVAVGLTATVAARRPGREGSLLARLEGWLHLLDHGLSLWRQARPPGPG